MAQQTSQGTLQPREGPEAGRQQTGSFRAEAVARRLKPRNLATDGPSGHSRAPRCTQPDSSASLGMTRKGSRLGVGNRCCQREALRIFSWLKCYAAELF